MKTLIALAGSLVVAGTASADLTDVFFEVWDNGGSDYVTYRLFAEFDNTADAIGAYAGLEGQPLFFSTDAPGGIYNDDGYFGGGHTDDIPFGNAGNLDIDTWLTIGQVGDFSGHPSFSPDFLGIPGGENQKVLVDGLTSFSDQNSAVFFPGAAVQVDTWGDASHVALAQFSVAAPGAAEMPFAEMGGVIQWVPEGGNAIQTEFYASIPAPGALALLGLAGLVGRRRR
jgi:hypothetical protein